MNEDKKYIKMKDLRIIIVSWNVRRELERCLHSVEKACEGLEYDVVVVDNASDDGTRDSMLAKCQMPNAKCGTVLNTDNRGFAKACNQGLAGLDARYVLLLNPDTECPPGSIASFVRRMDEHPENVGIAGPKLLNADGSSQQSVRRFPTVWSQAGILLKLHRLFRRANVFRRYFADDLDQNREQDVDQVMGACFLIRKELIDEIGGLDEQYFIWFEEVDYCRTAKERGWRVRYIPSASVIHHGGSSFAQVFSIKKQRMFNRSLIAYFKKWHPGWRTITLRILRPLSLLLSWALGMIVPLSHDSTVNGEATDERNNGATEQRSNGTARKARLWLFIVFFLELVSALTMFRDSRNAVTLLVVGLVVGIISFKRPTLGLAILLLELLIGSKGYLLQLWGWPGVFSLRIVLFSVFCTGWFFNFVSFGDVKRLLSEFFRRKAWVILFIAVIYGLVLGFASKNEFFFADANAWGFLLLLFPILDLGTRETSKLKSDILPVLFVGPIWLAMKTIGLEYLFSHGFPSVSPQTYLWVRRTGVGEVTLITANAFRIFMQSYIYFVPALLIGVAWMFRGKYRISNTEYRKNAPQASAFDIRHSIFDIQNLWLVATFVVLGISLSRSIWMGCVAGLVVLAWFYRKELFKSWSVIARIIVSGVIALVIIFATLAFPLPPVDYASLADLFGSRASTADAAAVSRWNLLPVVMDKIKQAPIMGHGFGATLTYETKDPRILAEHPDGMYTTYAFEWGWLEHWVKMGVLGIGAMLFLIWSLLRRTLALNAPKWLVYGVFASLIGIAVTHVFSPYFNHPLGIGALLMVEGWLTVGEQGS